jgi:hypothetical protein
VGRIAASFNSTDERRSLRLRQNAGDAGGKYEEMYGELNFDPNRLVSSFDKRIMGFQRALQFATTDQLSQLDLIDNQLRRFGYSLFSSSRKPGADTSCSQYRCSMTVFTRWELML